MTHAIVLIAAERSAIKTLGGALADVEGVAEAYSVTGEWDYVAMLRVREPLRDHLRELFLARHPHDRDEVPLAGDRVGLGHALDVGERAAQRRHRVALGLDEHDRGGHGVCTPPGSRTTTSA